MEDLLKLFDSLSTINDDLNVEKLDLSKKEDFDKYNNILNELEGVVKNNWLFGSIVNQEFIDNARKLGLEVYNKSKDETPSKPKEVDEKKDAKFFPSSKIENVDTKMQIHRLTQEYVDTMLKPYMEKGENTTNNINNAYTALFEFACWIYSHK